MIGQVLNHRYEILEKLGEGGMAVAYRGRDRVLGRTVAIKVMRPELSTDAEFLARFRREARASAGIVHEHIAAVYDTGRDGPNHYIVMEYVEGESLRERLRREGPLPLAETLRIATETAEALEAAHAAGIVHRDIKPGNILLGNQGSVKVTDFGIARAMASSGHGETGRVVGSVSYVSPEQARGDAVGPQSDVYSLGVTLFEMLTGRPPFEANDRLAVLHKHIYDRPPLASDLRSGLPEEVASVVGHCLEKDLSLRFASAREALSYLAVCPRTEAQGWRRSLKGMSPVRRLGQALGDVAWRVRRRAVLVGTGALLAAAGITAGTLWLSGDRPPRIPDLIGMGRAAAREQVETLHLGYREIGRKASDEVEAGAVLSQDPRAGTNAQEGAVVKVVLSAGSDQVVVPDVSEMALSQAELNLRAAGLNVGAVRENYDARAPKGYVRTTLPAPGVKVVKGTAVDVEISLGPKPTEVATPPPPTPPTPAESGSGRRETITYRVPADEGQGADVKVTIELDDARGRRTIYEGYHQPDEALPPQTFTVTSSTTVRILVNGTLRKELPFQP